MRNVFVIISVLLILGSCSSPLQTEQRIQNVGMLLNGNISDHVWNEKGYQGLVSLGEKYGMDVYYKENVATEKEIIKAIEEFSNQGVNLIFGHSSFYGKHFTDVAENYSHIQFVYFNGSYVAKNVTSFTFDTYAAGYFAGMLSGKMTAANKVSIIATYEWQSEIEGFFEGVKNVNPKAEIELAFLNDWNEVQTAQGIYQQMKSTGVDVFYPIGDTFSEEIIKYAKRDEVYAIGYRTNQAELAKNTVLTSTVHHVEKLYEYAVEHVNDRKLTGQLKSFDFQDGVISLAPFSDQVPLSYQYEMNQAMEHYTNTGLLPEM
ncbi:BMP family ABC transporter substrate-binding protein [Virgibacillus sp. Bac330]|uniref:BMP family ABC transporter substrate-binding protein n=1 Tax=Virgibacillus sp. Bac330 TaxID=2419841 RepID=UPI000EF4A7BB|nr:BMP family ABC transporter substrate-binding protein [Virgibacillus sp. Bac330]